jgi:hypothetical protein
LTKKGQLLQNGYSDLIKNCRVCRSWYAAHLCNLNSKTVNNIRNLRVIKMIRTARSNYHEILKKIWLLILELLPYLLAEWDEMKNIYRGPYIDAFCQVWFHLVQLFQRSRLKYEKLTDRQQTPSDGNTSPFGSGELKRTNNDLQNTTILYNGFSRKTKRS